MRATSSRPIAWMSSAVSGSDVWTSMRRVYASAAAGDVQQSRLVVGPGDRQDLVADTAR